MSVMSIASLATSMSQAQTSQQVGVDMLKKSIDTAKDSVSEILSTVQAPAPATNLPGNLGQNIDTTA